MEENERPAKRAKITADDVPEQGSIASISQTKTKQHQRKFNDRTSKQREQTGNSTSKRNDKARTFSHPSVICAGDTGVFITCDKGREKKSLLEFNDILTEYLEQAGIDVEGNVIQPPDQQQPGDENVADELDSSGIEAEIASELNGLKGGNKQGHSEATNTRTIQLITLDVPCVSFARFPPNSKLDAVDIVHQICLRAADPASAQQSRFIKRLTPVSNLGKALGQGLERACEAVLPGHFGAESGTVKFAIRPTVRNNEKLDRETIIKLAAGKVQEYGQNRHKVDLKGYEKCVLVEVYRGWVGMSVVHNGTSEKYKLGYDQLKKFNLAEVYANR